MSFFPPLIDSSKADLPLGGWERAGPLLLCLWDDDGGGGGPGGPGTGGGGGGAGPEPRCGGGGGPRPRFGGGGAAERDEVLAGGGGA